MSVVVRQTAPSRVATITTKMNFTPDAKDIFLWADGYWCYREDFYQQPRQNYAYLLVRKGSHQWQALTGGVAYTRSSDAQEHRIQSPRSN